MQADLLVMPMTGRSWRTTATLSVSATQRVGGPVSTVLVDYPGAQTPLAPSSMTPSRRRYCMACGHHHPLMAFVDHGAGGTCELVAALRRPGNAGSTTVSDHITAA